MPQIGILEFWKKFKFPVIIIINTHLHIFMTMINLFLKIKVKKMEINFGPSSTEIREHPVHFWL